MAQRTSLRLRVAAGTTHPGVALTGLTREDANARLAAAAKGAAT
jgi:hypothetical protein